MKVPTSSTRGREMLKLALAILGMIVILWLGGDRPAGAHKAAKETDGAKSSHVLDPSTLSLVTMMAHRPELMNLEYLQYFIGRPENERQQSASPTRTYFWYDARHRPIYELYQVHGLPGRVTDSTFVMHISDAGLTFKDLEELYGGRARSFFDYNGHPSQLYSFAPDTNLSFCAAQNTFAVGEAKVSYRGPALPTPSLEEMTAAQGQLMMRIQKFPDNKQQPDIVPLLMVRLTQHPEDGEAHYLLARAYARGNHVHDAIVQYNEALACASPSSDLRHRCVLGLEELHAAASPEASSRQPVGFELVQHGQRLRAEHSLLPKKDVSAGK